MKGLVLLGNSRECGLSAKMKGKFMANKQKLPTLKIRRKVKAANLKLFMNVDANRKPGQPNN
jgi:hypothetical protein